MGFSPGDYSNEVSSVYVIYLVNSNFEFIKSISSNTMYDTAGFTKGIRVLLGEGV